MFSYLLYSGAVVGVQGDAQPAIRGRILVTVIAEEEDRFLPTRMEIRDA
jgi:hypothetical protein